MAMLRALLNGLMLVAATAAADTHGYLRSGSAPAIRLAAVLPARPLVNQEILALSLPPKPVAEEAETAPTEPESTLYLDEAITALITERINALNARLTAVEAVTVTAEPPPDRLPLPDSPALPRSTSVNEAQQLAELLRLFKPVGGGSGTSEKSAVIVAPPSFLPPQSSPSPTSRATYSVPRP
ncbi:MAG TPA: hypothetical protein DCY13_02345 [Verrucomicrobiales bacterium]|nr:hypothetical protein [Verrucomicrobiales bacterium]